MCNTSRSAQDDGQLSERDEIIFIICCLFPARYRIMRDVVPNFIIILYLTADDFHIKAKFYSNKSGHF